MPLLSLIYERSNKLPFHAEILALSMNTAIIVKHFRHLKDRLIRHRKQPEVDGGRAISNKVLQSERLAATRPACRRAPGLERTRSGAK